MKAGLALLLIACAAPPAVPAPVPSSAPPAVATPPLAVADTADVPQPEPEPEPIVPAPAVTVVPAAKPVPPTRADMRSCAARGGKLQPVCMGGVIECVIRYRDAGKRCSDKKDCTGECLFVGTQTPTPGTPATGKCQTTSDSCGCGARVVGGRVQHMDCLD